MIYIVFGYNCAAQRFGAEEAHRAHNPRVPGSKPGIATPFFKISLHYILFTVFYLFYSIYFILFYFMILRRLVLVCTTIYVVIRFNIQNVNVPMFLCFKAVLSKEKKPGYSNSFEWCGVSQIC
jgi:hypothetical protein